MRAIPGNVLIPFSPDHLDEIYNKWPLLDDDIWCKLIIMERNRRIGKAYARVPIVTIDGSHELSYDGYKLALNGFGNPERDSETDECRKRIGKGIRIKMDNFGNILIKRLSKSGIYIKEWINPANMTLDNLPANQTPNVATGRAMPSRQQLIKMAAAGGATSQVASSLNNSSGTPTSSSSLGSSMEPPNDSAICDEVISVGGRLELDKIYVMFDMKKFQANITQELCRPYPDRRKLEQQCFSIVGLSRDSDHILDLACWVMVINIVALEMLNERFPIMPNHHRSQQPGYGPETIMSEMGAARRSQPSFVSIFDQPNHHNNHHHHQLASKEEDPYTLPANASSSDVKSSINDYGTTSTKNISSLMGSTAPANNGRHHHQLPSRYYGASRAHARRQAELAVGSSTSRQADIMRHRSKSNYDIYGPLGASSKTSAQRHERYNNSSSIYSPGHMLVPPPGDSVPPKLPPRDFKKNNNRSKSSTNMYDPNGMSSFDLMNDPNENIYSVGNQLGSDDAPDNMAAASRKVAKKNRFLESLKAPLELAKSSASNRSASVMGAPLSAAPFEPTDVATNNDKAKKAAAKSKGGFSKAKNLRSFLGVGGKSKELNNDANDHVDGDKATRRPGKLVGKSSKVTGSCSSNDNGETDSAVEPSEETDEGQQVASGSSAVNSSASYNDLDIPTPDYETDENIYALEEAAAAFDDRQQPQQQRPHQRPRRYSSGQKDSHIAQTTGKSTPGRQANSRNNKDDLYYSGFRAHIPKNSASSVGNQTTTATTTTTSDRAAKVSQTNQAQTSSLSTASSSSSSSSAGMLNDNHHVAHHINDNNNNDKMSCNAGSAREGGRHSSQTNQRLLSSGKLSGRDLIYGSTTGISAVAAATTCSPTTGSRYRSASMQRLYSRSAASQQQQQLQLQQQQTLMSAHRSHNDMYYDDPEADNPYASSGGLIGPGSVRPVAGSDGGAHRGHYGVLGGAHHRRRSSSRLAGPGSFAGGPAGGARVASSVAAANYDIGRSSSGIYGNNSGSSSSDYADWHPQMRKVNSSGYLNSIFKHHHHSQPQPVGSSSQLLLDAYETTGDTNNKLAVPPGGYKNNNNLNEKTLNNNNNNNNRTSRTLKSTMGSVVAAAATSRPASTLAKQQAHLHQVTSINGPAYRSYDSSNDSEPSYTNSSDGLDIYDHIGANSRIFNAHPHHLNHHKHHHLQQRRLEQQFLPSHAMVGPEIHVGEWENMYDR